jgi:D-sedoheptulose 7-phosphate isomerase
MTVSAASILSSSGTLKIELAKNTPLVASIQKAGEEIIARLKNGGTIYSCGNGGSSCDAAHFTEELVARYKSNRQPLRGIHFGDPGVLTCWGNDIGYEDAFRRQAEAFCTNRDILVGISTSGKSKNVEKAALEAKAKGALTIGLLGKDGGTIATQVDLPIVIPSQFTERIQEVHITIIHIWCEMLEEAFPAKNN